MAAPSPLIIDALNIPTPERRWFEEWRAGGVSAVNVTLAIWENAEETVRYIGKWRRVLDEHADLVGLATSSEEIERLAVLSVPVHLKTGETLALDGAPRALLLLGSGRVRVHEPSATGPGLTISMVEKPTLVAQTGFAASTSRAVVVEGLEPSVLLMLEGEDFEGLVRRNPEVGVKTIRVLGERLSACEGRLSDLARKEVPARLASLFLGLSERRGLLTASGGRMIPTRYTHQQLAGMVGSNREAVTRALGRLRKAGAVEVRNQRIHVTDGDALERLAGAQR
jgi:CRP/FNR family transcriptional regulator